jgi:hypothetical protein
MYCGNAAAVHWDKPAFTSPRRPDHDAVVCVTLLMLPILPLRPCHVFDHTGTVNREVPLRWSWSLVARALVRPWLILATGVGALMAIMLAFLVVYSFVHGQQDRLTRPRDPSGVFFMAGVGMLLPIGLFGLRWFSVRDRANRDIRLVMGRHVFGSSDPALWRPDVLGKTSLKQLIGSDDAARTAEAALSNGHFSRAMLAARLLRASGDARGEAFTARILAEPRVVELLNRIRKKPWTSAELAPRMRPASPDPFFADRILFYDGRRYSKDVLDAAGGPSFSSFVQENPTLVRAAPSHIAGRVILWALPVLIVAALLSPTGSSMSRKERLFGTVLLCSFIGWILKDTYKRQVTIGAGRLNVAGQTALLDAVKKVGRRRFLGFFPSVSVEVVGGLIEWPYRTGESEELERVLNAVIALRSLAPYDQTSPILSDGRTV